MRHLKIFTLGIPAINTPVGPRVGEGLSEMGSSEKREGKTQKTEITKEWLLSKAKNGHESINHTESKDRGGGRGRRVVRPNG